MSALHPNTAAAVEMVRKGSTRTEAAIRYGLAVPTVTVACQRAGIAPAERGRPAHPNTEAAVAMVRKGSTRTEAAIHYGLSIPTVTVACQRAGIVVPHRGRPPHPNTAAAVEMVRKGSTRTAAAIHYGLAIPTVTLACQRAGIASAKRGRPQGRRSSNGRDWSKTDWRKNNSQIARAIGLTPERVRQVRKELGKFKKPA